MLHLYNLYKITIQQRQRNYLHLIRFHYINLLYCYYSKLLNAINVIISFGFSETYMRDSIP